MFIDHVINISTFRRYYADNTLLPNIHTAKMWNLLFNQIMLSTITQQLF